MKRHLIEDLRSRVKANQENEKTSNETLESLERKVLLSCQQKAFQHAIHTKSIYCFKQTTYS